MCHYCLVVASLPHEVGGGFVPSYTKDHHKNG